MLHLDRLLRAMTHLFCTFICIHLYLHRGSAGKLTQRATVTAVSLLPEGCTLLAPPGCWVCILCLWLQDLIWTGVGTPWLNCFQYTAQLKLFSGPGFVKELWCGINSFFPMEDVQFKLGIFWEIFSAISIPFLSYSMSVRKAEAPSHSLRQLLDQSALVISSGMLVNVYQMILQGDNKVMIL